VTNFSLLTAKDWALRWIKGSIESYFIGKTPLEIVKGRIKRAVKSYEVNLKEVGAIANSILVNPSLNALKELREERAKPLIEFLNELEKSEKDG
jgi:sporulation protein YlmC with PRC-barrel domain